MTDETYLRMSKLFDSWMDQMEGMDVDSEKAAKAIKNLKDLSSIDLLYYNTDQACESRRKLRKLKKLEKFKLPSLTDTDKKVVGDVLNHLIAGGVVAGTTFLAIHADEEGIMVSNLAMRLLPKIRVD